ncbi:MAG: hypothetical protein DWQ07_17090 [Chloroflexi bacterium]|nr:MAG: hypothetical protein DWQ07_17090 [Chloroflexota bacterium]MBL1195121.1 hypothetical protein [Chloroflexota bacterium]NOH12406.1 hypothetical protein [Chloroflexota bacterium]
MTKKLRGDHSTTRCPHCQSDIEVGADPLVGDRVKCPTCKKVYEILWLYPIELCQATGHVSTIAESTIPDV